MRKWLQEILDGFGLPETDSDNQEVFWRGKPSLLDVNSDKGEAIFIFIFLNELGKSSAFQLRGKEFKSTRTNGEKGPRTPTLQPGQESKAQHTSTEAK